jgi:high-affinity iron transporter
LAIGVLTGTLIYAGFIALPLRRVFVVTDLFLVLIAVGTAARGANFLAQAGLILSPGARLWPISPNVSDQGPSGQFLLALIGHIIKSSGIEILIYGLTISCIDLFVVNAPKRANARQHKEKMAP